MAELIERLETHRLFTRLGEDVGKWSQYNFGDQSPHRPAMGIVEEICELEEAIEALDADGAEDAIGDIMIYMADYHYRRGWDLGTTYAQRFLITPAVSMPLYLIKNLSHSHLKGEQNIRGGSEKHDAKMKETCSACVGYLERIAAFMDLDFISTVDRTWEKVSKRDWKKNPDTAHEVAVPDMQMQPTGEP